MAANQSVHFSVDKHSALGVVNMRGMSRSAFVLNYMSKTPLTVIMIKFLTRICFFKIYIQFFLIVGGGKQHEFSNIFYNWLCPPVGR